MRPFEQTTEYYQLMKQQPRCDLETLWDHSLKTTELFTWSYEDEDEYEEKDEDEVEYVHSVKKDNSLVRPMPESHFHNEDFSLDFIMDKIPEGTNLKKVFFRVDSERGFRGFTFSLVLEKPYTKKERSEIEKSNNEKTAKYNEEKAIFDEKMKQLKIKYLQDSLQEQQQELNKLK